MEIKRCCALNLYCIFRSYKTKTKLHVIMNKNDNNIRDEVFHIFELRCEEVLCDTIDFYNLTVSVLDCFKVYEYDVLDSESCCR